jgi:hypothetical protein
LNGFKLKLDSESFDPSEEDGYFDWMSNEEKFGRKENRKLEGKWSFRT